MLTLLINPSIAQALVTLQQSIACICDITFTPIMSIDSNSVNLLHRHWGIVN